MALIVDHSAIIERIIAILKNNKTIYNTDDPVDKLRKIIFAESDAGHKDDSTPYAWIAIADNFQSTNERIGTSQTDFSQNQAEYHIVIIAQKRAVAETQKQLFYFSDLVVRELRANPTLKDPVALNDPKVKRSNILRVSRYEPDLGREVAAIRIVLSVQVGVTWQLEIPASSVTLDLISKPLDVFNVQDNLDREDDGQIENTPFDKEGRLNIEVEIDAATSDIIENLIDGFGKHQVNIKKDGTTIKTRNVTFNSMSKPVPFDNIERAVISMTMIP